MLLGEALTRHELKIAWSFAQGSQVVYFLNRQQDKCTWYGLANDVLNVPLSVFLPEELRLALMPTLEKLYKQEPESLPFRQPVDPKLLGCLVSVCDYKLFCLQK